MRILLAGAAALAITSAAAHADPGNGKGNGNGGQQHAAAKPDRGKAGGNGNRAPGTDVRADRSSPGQRAVSKPRSADVRDSDRRSVGGPDRSSAPKMIVRDQSRVGAARLADARDRDFLVRDNSRDLIAGCPPGLARKNNGCQPPGQAKQQFRAGAWHGYDYRPNLFGLNNYATGNYYYSNGYLLRPSNDGGIAGYIPLLGGALAVGNVWPASYQSYAVPDYYVDYYDLGPAQSYRYADNVIYRVDPGDAAIASVAALLTGDEFAVGQPMPSGYDVYNVPYSYRDRYADTNNAWYRYSDGYVYRIDPETQLVAAAIDLLI